MDCPRDHGQLKSTRIGSISVDHCAKCNGSWYDLDELRLLKDMESDGDYCWIDLDLWKDREKFRSAKQQRLRCPRAGHAMTTVRYGESPIAVDICPDCHGVWLDGHEYERIVAYLEHTVNATTTGEYLKDVKDEFVEIFHGGREGLISELKDIDRVLYLLQLRFKIEHPLIAGWLSF